MCVWLNILFFPQNLNVVRRSAFFVEKIIIINVLHDEQGNLTSKFSAINIKVVEMNKIYICP